MRYWSNFNGRHNAYRSQDIGNIRGFGSSSASSRSVSAYLSAVPLTLVTLSNQITAWRASIARHALVRAYKSCARYMRAAFILVRSEISAPFGTILLAELMFQHVHISRRGVLNVKTPTRACEQFL